MTTVWRPRVRIPVPDIDGADADENRRDESTTKGTKRKRAPMHHGPCEHGVKPRSKCKVCSACPHGRRRSSARSAVGHNMRARSSALSLQGVRWVTDMRARSSALYMQGVRWVRICEHGRQRPSARSAVGHQSASTVVSATAARNAVVQEYASTVVSALSARSAVGQEYASTVVGALSARSAVGHQSASTVVSALGARSAVGQEYASTVVYALRCKECHTAKQ